MGRKEERKSVTLTAYATGVLAAMVAETVTFPADIVKTRLQIQGSGQTKGPTHGVVGTFTSLLKNEGLAGLYRGLPPSCARHFVYSGIRMTMYETIREDVFGREADGSFPLWKGILAGMSTGALAQFFATPCDLVKVQMQIDGKRLLQGESLRYKGTVDAYAQIWRTSGIRGMFQGWAPSCQRSALVQLGDLAAYDAAKQRIVKVMGDNTLCHVLSSACAGLVAAFMSCPADVIKTRVMNQDASNPIYKGSIDCLQQTVRKEGILSLWKGFGPAYLRCAPWSMTFFITYEQLRKIAGQDKYCA